MIGIRQNFYKFVAELFGLIRVYKYDSGARNRWSGFRATVGDNRKASGDSSNCATSAGGNALTHKKQNIAFGESFDNFLGFQCALDRQLNWEFAQTVPKCGFAKFGMASKDG